MTQKTLSELEKLVGIAYRNAKATADALATTPTIGPKLSPIKTMGAPAVHIAQQKELPSFAHDNTPVRALMITNTGLVVRDSPSTVALRSGALRILCELAARAPAGYTRPQVGALTKFSHKGGTFNQYLSDLRKAGFITERDNMVFASNAGIATFGDKPPSPTTHDEAMAQWGTALRSGAFKMLQGIIAAREEGIHRANLADIVNMTASGGTFNTYLSDLRRNGLIEERGKRLFANDILFP